jgi:RNA polymerase sigma factor (sigma-70 family)
MDMLLSPEDIEENFLLREDSELLRKALRLLPCDFREIIYWYYFKEKTLKEYAKLKNIKYEAAKKRKERALNMLKKIIMEQSK